VRPEAIIKRDGTSVRFEPGRIAGAIAKALEATSCADAELAHELALAVGEHLERVCARPEVDLEEVQDAVIHVLQESGHYQAAIAYARYRDDRERARRSRPDGVAPHLLVLDEEGRSRRLTPQMVSDLLQTRFGLDLATAAKAAPLVDTLLAGTAVEELPVHLLCSLVETALVRGGMHAVVRDRAPLRVERAAVEQALCGAADGRGALLEAGRLIMRRRTLAQRLPQGVRRHYASGRLWVDGLDDPRRGSQCTLVLESHGNPWQVLVQALTLAQDLSARWRRVRLVLPPSILGHLERGSLQFVPPLLALARQSEVYLACDGRTPLLDDWPFAATRPEPSADLHGEVVALAPLSVPLVSLAVAQEDFLLQRRLQELGLPLLSGPHLFHAGWSSRTAAELAVNATGLEEDYALLDSLALAVVEAAQQRMRELGNLVQGTTSDLVLGHPGSLSPEPRCSVTGLPHHHPARTYLERQIAQEGQRAGLSLRRSASLSESACQHLGRLMDPAAP
jgi:hypothetical protein